MLVRLPGILLKVQITEKKVQAHMHVFDHLVRFQSFVLYTTHIIINYMYVFKNEYLSQTRFESIRYLDRKELRHRFI